MRRHNLGRHTEKRVARQEQIRVRHGHNRRDIQATPDCALLFIVAQVVWRA
jgi:hypothetical protein